MIPASFSVDDLRNILVACAGEADGELPLAEFADTEFEDLGYDSLAVMETAARIERDYGVRIADSKVADARTPRDMVSLVVNGSEQEAG